MRFLVRSHYQVAGNTLPNGLTHRDALFQLLHTLLDTKDQTLTVSWHFQNQEQESENTELQLVYHYFYPHQIIMLFQQAGLRPEKMMGGYKGEPFEEDSERLLLLASLPE